MNKKVLVVPLLMVVITLSGCNTMEGLGKDIKNAGTSLEKSAQKKTSSSDSESE